METKISKAQAKEFAYSFLSDIPAFIEHHKAEYLAYLESTGQVDQYYQNITEAENEHERRASA